MGDIGAVDWVQAKRRYIVAERLKTIIISTKISLLIINRYAPEILSHVSYKIFFLVEAPLFLTN